VTWVHEGETRTLDLTAAAAGAGEIADRDVLIVPKRALGAVTIAGAVAKEGIYPLDPAQPLRLGQAVITAGGATPLAKLDQVVLTHADGTKQTVNLELGPAGMGPDGEIALRDGDILYLPARSRRDNAVYVFGAATVQGLFDFREGMTLLEVLGAAQPMPYAKLGEIAVHRKAADGKAIKIAAGDTVRGKAADVPLQRNDLVIIPGSPPGAPKRNPFDLLAPLLYLLL
jgi:protein involved in polysaccharide export with SLBB domain